MIFTYLLLLKFDKHHDSMSRMAWFAFFPMLFVGLPLSSTQKTHVEQLFERFWSSAGVELKLRRQIYVELVSQSKIAEGQLKFSQGLFRLSLASPSQSELVYDGKTLWQAQEIDPELGGGWQVTKTQNTQALKGSGFMKLLFGDKNVFANLHLAAKEKKSPDVMAFSYTPKDAAEFGSIKKFTIEMNVPKMTLTKLSYTDENENQVTYDFLTFKKMRQVSKTDFVYRPPADAKITEIK